MAEQYDSVRLLGIDQRVLDEDAPDGLCEALRNLRPDGTPQRPYWRVDYAGPPLTNAAGQEFSYFDQNDIAGAHWQVRSSIGDEGDPDASLKRLVLGLGDGRIDIIDPNKGAGGWEIAESHIIADESAEYGFSFADVNDIVVIATTKNGEPYKMFNLQDDAITQTSYPILPFFRFRMELNKYDQADIDAGAFEGIHPGWYAVRYGYRLTSGGVARVSPPFPFQINDVFPVETTTAVLRFFSGGYDGAPPNMSAWEGIITGIDVYLSERKESKKELFDATYHKLEHVENWNYDSDLDTVIDLQSGAPSSHSFEPGINLLFSWTGKTEEIPNGEVLPPDDFSHQEIAGAVVSSYNSWLIVGGTRSMFSPPEIFYNKDFGTVLNYLATIETNDGGATWTADITFLALNGLTFNPANPPSVERISGSATFSFTTSANNEYMSATVEITSDAGTSNDYRITVPVYSYGSDIDQLYKVGEHTLEFTLTLPS